jgi:NAD-reducing hydrogenase large subunit
MGRDFTIDPITRIEGYSKITISLDEAGEVTDARFHVTQFRGFERICQGRPVHEMPSLMARICGICPVSHLVASSKACDEILAVEPPPTGVDLRRIMTLAQIVQSHALSFFYLSSPDLLFGFDAEASVRHLFGVLRQNPQLACDGVDLRRFGQQIIEQLGGKRIHPAGIVPGGVFEPLTAEKRDAILAVVPSARAATERTLGWYTSSLARWDEEASRFADFPSAFMGLVDRDGAVDYYDGLLRVVDSDGVLLADRIDPRPYSAYLGEAVESWSYLKAVFWKDRGYPQGIYRVGPRARLNVARPAGHHEPTSTGRVPPPPREDPTSSFHYHHARLIEMLSAIERIEALLNGPNILAPRVRSQGGINRNEGVGVAEAPRGTLIHHYRVDDDGLVQWANLVIATGHNNLAMNRGVLQVAKHYVKGDQLQESMLNRVEAVVRCYDPCLSCSTHAIGQMPLRVQLLGVDGNVLDELRQ